MGFPNRAARPRRRRAAAARRSAAAAGGAAPGPGGAYTPPPGGGGGGSWFADNRNWLLPVGGVLLVLVLVGGFLAFSGDEAGADEIFLEPRRLRGRGPVHRQRVDHRRGGSGRGGRRGQDQVDGSVNGSEEGLYGGTLNACAVDREKLVGFLTTNPTRHEHGPACSVVTDEIPAYVRNLTPTVLLYDTRVTNHGFANGRATAFQSVLQAGTAVLVDGRGNPVVRCRCGNPLTEPIEVDSPSYGGNRSGRLRPGERPGDLR